MTESRVPIRHKRPRRIELRTGRNWWFRLVLVSLFGFCGYQAWYLFYESSYFVLEEISVVGNRNMPREEVFKVAGLYPGDRVFRLDFAKVEQRLTEDPRVIEARLVHVSPRHVRVHLTERKPLVHFVNDVQVMGLDSEGWFFAVRWPEAYPKVHVQLSKEELESNRLSTEKMQVLRTWMDRLGSSSLRDYESLKFFGEGAVHLVFGGVTILLGSEETFFSHEAKVRPFLDLASSSQWHPQFIDIRFEDMVVKLA